MLTYGTPSIQAAASRECTLCSVSTVSQFMWQKCHTSLGFKKLKYLLPNLVLSAVTNGWRGKWTQRYHAAQTSCCYSWWSSLWPLGVSIVCHARQMILTHRAIAPTLPFSLCFFFLFCVCVFNSKSTIV